MASEPKTPTEKNWGLGCVLVISLSLLGGIMIVLGVSGTVASYIVIGLFLLFSIMSLYNKITGKGPFFKKCPFCVQRLEMKARVCPHCTRELPK